MNEESSIGAKVGPSQPARLVTRQSRRKSSAPYSRPASSPGGKTGLTTYLEETSLEWSEKAAVNAAVSHTPRGNMLTAELQRDPSQGFGMILNSNNRVTQIISGSPAEKAGVHVFDLVVKVDGRATLDSTVFDLIGTKGAVVLTLDRPPASLHGAIAQGENQNKRPGVPALALGNVQMLAADKRVFTVVLSREPKGIWGIRTDDDNKLMEVTVDTAAYKAKLQRGDVIVKVDGKKVEGNVRGIIMKEYKDKTNLVLTARRGPRPSPRLAATPLPPRRPPSTPPPQPLSLSLYRLSLGAWQVQRGVSVQAKLSTRKQALCADI